MQEAIEALIIQNKKNNEEVTSLLEALLMQGKKDSTETILETIIQQNEKLVGQMKKVKEAVSSIPEKDNSKMEGLLGDILKEIKEKEINVTLEIV